MIIDFQVDEEELANSIEEDITQDDYKICYVTTMFMMPIRMQINGIELFELHGNPWCAAPLISVASDGLLHVKNLKLSGKEKYAIIEGPGDIIFTMVDSINVKLDFYDGSDHTVTTAKYDELLNAFQEFAEKVRKFLRERAPQINDHHYWGPWLRGERD